MAKKKEGLEALLQAQKQRKDVTPRHAPDEPTSPPPMSAVYPGSENPEFNKVTLTGGAGPRLKRSRVAENPTVYHPIEEISAESEAIPAAPTPSTRETSELRKNIAASTSPKSELTKTEAMKLMLQCNQLLSEFQDVARAFQKAAGGRREGPAYEAWRDLNHAQVLIYRCASVMREGYGLQELKEKKP